MTDLSINLNELQIDFLKELTNIGGGNAATSLSQLLNRPIDMEVPDVKLLSYNKVFSNIKSEDEQVVAVSMRALGDAPGSFLFILNLEEANTLVRIMTSNNYEINDEIGESALKEIVNIIVSSYVNALSRLLQLSLVSSVPLLAKDMFGAILSTTYIELGQIDESILIIKNQFIENNRKINLELYFIPVPGVLEKIFRKIGIK